MGVAMIASMKTPKAITPIERIEDRIHTARGKRVMLEADLARLYGVETRRLNEQARRNADRFPEDFAFKPTNQELADLRSQNATSNESPRVRGGRRYRPLVFTEHEKEFAEWLEAVRTRHKAKRNFMERLDNANGRG